MTEHNFSVTVDLRSIKTWGKAFKHVATLIRSGAINEHGFMAQKGLTNLRFRNWSIAIRFKTAANRDEFCSEILRVLHPRVVNRIVFKPTTPRRALSQPIRLLRAS
ncbi:hypothetical protein AL051_11240 [Pseudomonas amygdali pv. dendropanacis]|nr:hypothetical protein AL051_11240 [Pseudomonas amygdali pv. dendropanacis]